METDNIWFNFGFSYTQNNELKFLLLLLFFCFSSSPNNLTNLTRYADTIQCLRLPNSSTRDQPRRRHIANRRSWSSPASSSASSDSSSASPHFSTPAAAPTAALTSTRHRSESSGTTTARAVMELVGVKTTTIIIIIISRGIKLWALSGFKPGSGPVVDEDR